MLACVDGTQSRNWMAKRPDTGRWNSNTRNFFLDCTDAPKQYFNGPNLAGTDVMGIAGDVWDFLMDNLRRDPQLRVNLVGHSRGGHIVTAVAGFLNRYGWLKHLPEKSSPSFFELCDAEGADLLAAGAAGEGAGLAQAMKLNRLDSLRKRAGVQPSQVAQPVNFLGLYDAVDRSEAFQTGTITSNVRLAYHAVRDPAWHSRDWFGHTARHMDEPQVCSTRVRNAQPGCAYHEKVIMGSHGAIGGDPGGGDIKYDTHLRIDALVGSKRPANLQRCTTPIVTSRGPDYVLSNEFYSVPLRTTRYECEVIDQNIKRTELTASIAADNFIRTGAQVAGLGFK